MQRCGLDSCALASARGYRRATPHPAPTRLAVARQVSASFPRKGGRGFSLWIGIGGTIEQARDQGATALWNAFDRIARLLHRLQRLDHAGGRIQANAVADAAIAVGVVGQDD